MRYQENDPSIKRSRQMDSNKEGFFKTSYVNLNTAPVINTPAEAMDHIRKVILEKYQHRPIDKRVLEEMKAHIKSMLSDFERSGIVCPHDIEVVQDPNDFTHILIREPITEILTQEKQMGWTDEDWCEVVNKQDERLKQYDSLVTNIRNILTDAGIPDHEEYPDDVVDDYEKSLRTGGRMIPLDKRVQMLADRSKNNG